MRQNKFNLEAVMVPLPSTKQEIIDRSGKSLNFVQEVVLRKLLMNEFSQTEKYHLAPFCKVLDMTRCEESLAYIWETATVDGCFDKQDVLAVVFHTSKGHEIFETLTEPERIEFSSPWLRPMVVLSESETFPRYAIRALFCATDKKHWALLIDKCERLRKESNLEARHVYEQCFELPGFSLPF